MTRFDRQLAERRARRDSRFEVYQYYGALEGQDHEEDAVHFDSSDDSGANGGESGA